MIACKDHMPVFLACGATDLRKSVNGLTTIVEYTFKMDPLSQALFVFCNRSRNRIKILHYDKNGWWIYYKRLDGGRFKWPEVGEQPTMDISSGELNTLLSLSALELKIKRKDIPKSWIA